MKSIEILNEFDQKNDHFCEEDIYSALANCNDKDSLEYQFERMAFYMHSHPDIKNDITQDTISYWASRLKQVSHPIIQARYADLFWIYGGKHLDRKEKVTAARIAVDSYLKTCQTKKSKDELKTIYYLKRALQIAIEINDKKLIIRTKKVLVEFRDAWTDNEVPGVYIKIFDIFWTHKKYFDQTEELEFVADIEKRLEVLINEKDPILTRTKLCLECLLPYYNKGKSDKAAIKRLLQGYYTAYEKASKDLNGMQKHYWLGYLAEQYRLNGFKNEFEQIMCEIKTVDEESLDELQQIYSGVFIPEEEIEKSIKNFLVEDTYTAICLIAYHLVIPKALVIDIVRENKREYPYYYFASSHRIMDPTGRVIAEISGNDNEGLVVLQMHQILKGHLSLLINRIFEWLEKEGVLTPEKICKIIFQSPLFSDSHKPTVRQAIEAYFNKNHMIFIHLIIPQIEAAFRELLIIRGGNCMKKINDSYEYKTLNDILSDEIIKNTLPEDTIFFLRVVLADKRGWNIRNNVSHGIWSEDEFNVHASQRLLQILFLLGLFKKPAKQA